MTEGLFQEAKQKAGFKEACNTSEILVRTAYIRAIEGILDMGGTDDDSVQAIFGANQFLSEYSNLLEKLSNSDAE